MNSSEGIRSFGSAANQVAFPLGGIGTGNVSLGVHGNLKDWEVSYILAHPSVRMPLKRNTGPEESDASRPVIPFQRKFHERLAMSGPLVNSL